MDFEGADHLMAGICSHGIAGGMIPRARRWVFSHMHALPNFL